MFLFNIGLLIFFVLRSGMLWLINGDFYQHLLLGMKLDMSAWEIKRGKAAVWGPADIDGWLPVLAICMSQWVENAHDI
jgi:hypothetical protein